MDGLNLEQSEKFVNKKRPQAMKESLDQYCRIRLPNENLHKGRNLSTNDCGKKSSLPRNPPVLDASLTPSPASHQLYTTKGTEDSRLKERGYHGSARISLSDLVEISDVPYFSYGD
jgi:hypothetical protein